MGKNNVIEISNLSKSFGNKKIIDNIDLTVKEGDVFGFLGPNGSGKTTTIRMMLNLIHPDGGFIKINGYDLKRDFNKAINRVGAIVESPRFYPYLSGRKNLELMANLMDEVSRDRIDEVLELVSLTNRAGDKFKTYSLGMKQRLGIANALLNNPRIIILDEPTNGLDPNGMKEIRDLICELSTKEKITFFISTHLLHEVEQMCNKVAILHKGRILAKGVVEDLLNMDYETIEISTPLPKEALSLLQEHNYVKRAQESQKGIIAQIEKGYSAEINKYLVKNSINVKYLTPNNQSLEEFFIQLTKEVQ